MLFLKELLRAMISANLSGSADGNKNLQRRRFHRSEQKSVFSVTGTLHVNDLVKNQMAELIKKYDEKPSDFADISLSKTKFQFVAKLTCLKVLNLLMHRPMRRSM